MRSFMFWGVLPFLLPQALYVQKTAPRFSPAAGPTQGSAGVGAQKRLLAIGDSIIAGVGASELSKALVGQTATALAESTDHEIAWQAIGVSGYDSRKVLDLLVPQLPDEAADFIIISVGVNDVTGLTTLPTWEQNLVSLIEQLRSFAPEAPIAVAGLPPLHGFPLLPQPLRATFGMRARSLDEVARRVVQRFECAVYVPVDFDPDPEKFAGDGYHPSEESYTEFGRQMADGLLDVGNSGLNRTGGRESNF